MDDCFTWSRVQKGFRVSFSVTVTAGFLCFDSFNSSSCYVDRDFPFIRTEDAQLSGSTNSTELPNIIAQDTRATQNRIRRGRLAKFVFTWAEGCCCVTRTGEARRQHLQHKRSGTAQKRGVPSAGREPGCTLHNEAADGATYNGIKEEEIKTRCTRSAWRITITELLLH